MLSLFLIPGLFSASAATTFEERVVGFPLMDVSGDPVEGVTIELQGLEADGTWSPLGRATTDSRGWFSVRSSDERIASFETVQARARVLGLEPVLVEVGGSDLVRRLENPIPIGKDPSFPRLQLPPCGFLRLELPAFASGEVEFRSPTGDESAVALIREGLAVLPVVLEQPSFRFLVQPSRREPCPLDFIDGPRVAGEVITRRLEGIEQSFALFTGRFVDFQERVLSHVRFEVRTEESTWLGTTHWTGSTDGDGRFWIPQAESPSGPLEYEIRVLAGSSDRVHRDRFALRESSSGTAAGIEDWGDVMVLSLAPADEVRLLSDETLRALLDRTPHRGGFTFHDVALVHTLFREVAGRGPAWIPLLESEPPTFTLQTLICRARGEADPVEVLLDDMLEGQELVVPLLENPVVSGILRNQSLKGVHYFPWIEGELVPRLERAGGEVVEPTPKGAGLAAMAGPPEFSVDDWIPFSISLGSRYDVLLPGQYDVQILHQHDTALATAVDLEAQVTSASVRFQLQVLPRRVTLSRHAELEPLLPWLSAIDRDRRPVLCEVPWSEGQGLSQVADRPEDLVYCMGPRIVPVLIDQLGVIGDPRLDRWICALLHDLTGLYRPCGDLAESMDEVARWPGVDRVEEELDEWGDPWPQTLEEAVRHWKRLRAGYELEVVEDG